MSSGITLGLSALTMGSREIADLTGKRHDNVLRDGRAMLIELHGESNLLKFEGIYRDERNRTYDELRLPKRETLILVSGYSLQMRAKIIDRWQELEEKIIVPQPVTIANDVQVRHELVRDYCSRFPNIGTAAQQVLYAKILNPVLGGDVLPLPILEQKHLSATEVGEKLGVSGNAIGRAAAKHGLKTKEHGIWVLDKSASSNKQVEVFKYNEAGIQKLESILHPPVRAPGEAQPDLLGGV